MGIYIEVRFDKGEWLSLKVARSYAMMIGDDRLADNLHFLYEPGDPEMEQYDFKHGNLPLTIHTLMEYDRSLSLMVTKGEESWYICNSNDPMGRWHKYVCTVKQVKN